MSIRVVIKDCVITHKPCQLYTLGKVYLLLFFVVIVGYAGSVNAFDFLTKPDKVIVSTERVIIATYKGVFMYTKDLVGFFV